MKHLAPAVLLALSACGESTPEQSIETVDAGWDLEQAGVEMRAALQDGGDVDIVFAHTDGMARAARESAREMERDGTVFIGVGGLPEEGQRYVREGVLDASIEVPTGGAEGVDLALLAMADITLPDEIPLGTVVWTEDNIETGGDVMPFVGAFVMAVLRQEGSDALSTAEDGEPVTLGVLQCIEDPVRAEQTMSDILERAGRYPRLTLETQEAGDDLDLSLRQLIAQGPAAVLVVMGRRPLPSEASLWAITVGIPVIVLGDDPATDTYTCLVRADNMTIGRTAGDWAVQRLESGGRILEISGSKSSLAAQHRSTGFAAALAPEVEIK